MRDTLQVRPDEDSRADDLLTLVYSSVATVPFSEIDLALLLSVSRLNNEAHRLTGVLLHRDGRFMQALEGPAHAVRATVRRIAADPRHTDLRILDEEYVDERRYGSWAMGYQVPTEADLATTPAWFGSPEALDEHDGTRADHLLAWFRASTAV